MINISIDPLLIPIQDFTNGRDRNNCLQKIESLAPSRGSVGGGQGV